MLFSRSGIENEAPFSMFWAGSVCSGILVSEKVACSTCMEQRYYKRYIHFFQTSTATPLVFLGSVQVAETRELHSPCTTLPPETPRTTPTLLRHC
mmetsp:Transcript_139408/g.242462  ORF Transcript_139408/g.242462 Transcript_139408/m.242462 type:complete len:95 (+) Transcript_139408:419-703(+)